MQASTSHRTRHARRRRAYRGFTVIELFVVVGIMAFIAAVAIPLTLSRLQTARDARAAAASISQAALEAHTVGPTSGATAARLVSSDVGVTLRASTRLEGTELHSRYAASFRGRFEVQNVDAGSSSLDLVFPLPPGISEAHGVRLLVADPREPERLVEPPDVRYALDAIRWRAPVAAQGSVIAVVEYEAVGRDRFAYQAAGAGRTGTIRCTIDVVGTDLATVGPSSLEPTSAAPTRLVWDLGGVVADRPIVVDLPAGASPLGRLVTMLRFAGVAILFFGAGFWYLAEGWRPGCMDRFRWAHFLLLALTYSLYFAIFGVLVRSQPVALAVAAAALGSLPLVGVHVARILDRRFAVTRALPLAAFTLAAVTGLVLLDGHRPVLVLGAAVVVIAYPTLTFGRWSARRRVRAAGAAEAERRAGAAASLDESMVVLARTTAAAAPVLLAADRALGEHLEGLEHEREDVAEAARRLRALVAAAADGCTAARACARDATAGAGAVRAEEASIKEQTLAVVAAQSALDTAVEALRKAAACARVARRAARARPTAHCTACRRPSAVGAPYCEHCGRARPHVLVCRGCSASLRIPAQIVRRDWRAVAVHCERCGEQLEGSAAEAVAAAS